MDQDAQHALQLTKTHLTAEQRHRIEENRRKALQKLQQRKQNQTSPSSPSFVNARVNPKSYRTFSPNGPKIVDPPSKESSTANTKVDGSPSVDIAARIERKRRQAFERLQNRQRKNEPGISPVRSVAPENGTQVNVTNLPKNLKYSDCHAATSTITSSAKPQGPRNEITNTWNEKFSYQKKMGCSPNRNNLNDLDTSKSGSLIARINNNSSKEVASFAGSPKHSDVSSTVRAKSGHRFQLALVLMNLKRFEAKCKFDADVVGVFKTMGTKVYDSRTKTWNFALTEHDRLVSALRLLKIDLTLQDIPSKVLDIIKGLPKENGNETKSVELSKIGEDLERTLFPFQRLGVSYGIRNNGRLLIADDMGLGKTIQAISLACYYRSDWPVLVVSPSSVKVAWAKEFQRRVPSLELCDINIVHTGKDDPARGLVNILSYDMLPKHVDALKRKAVKIIIADESHFIKNSKAARTKAAMELLKRATRVILLSGTPALSRPIELYTQLCAVNPKLFPSVHAYAQRYCDAKRNRFGWDYSGSSNLEELRIVLENKVMIRRLKNDVLDELPDKQRQIVLLDPSSVNIKSLAGEAKKLEKTTGTGKRQALLEFFSSTCEAKKKAVLEYITDLLEGEKKFILFAHHRLMLNSIAEMLEKNKISFIRIDGSTAPSARQQYVETFQNDEHCLVALLSITAANIDEREFCPQTMSSYLLHLSSSFISSPSFAVPGLNLTAATTVVFAELYWNPGALVQAEDRVYRIGQKNAVMITYLLAENTADDYIWPLVQSKLDVLTSAGLNQDEFSSEVTQLKDPRQRKILDYFHELMDDDKDFLQWIEEDEEPASKRLKTGES